VERSHFLCLDKHVVFRIRRRALQTNEHLPRCGAADADVQPPRADHRKVTGGKVRTLDAYQAFKSLDPRDDRLQLSLLHRLHLLLAPREKGRACEGRLLAQPTDDVGFGRPVVRLGQPAVVAREKAVPQRVAVAHPAALPRGEIDGAEEPDDIDERRAARRVIEIVEAPGVVGERELLHVRVAVEAHDRRIRDVGEGLADPRDPGAIDEAKINERVSAEPIEQLGLRSGQRLRRWPERYLC
jgi:hypothetical protein